MRGQWLLFVLGAVLVAALLFVLIPVQKATTVHNSIANNLDVQRILLNDVDIGACTGPGVPSANCIAVDTIELIPSGVFWIGSICINNDDAGVGDTVAGILLVVDGAFLIHPGTTIEIQGSGTDFECFNLGGNGLQIQGLSNDVDITLAYSREG